MPRFFKPVHFQSVLQQYLQESSRQREEVKIPPTPQWWSLAESTGLQYM